MVEEVGDGAVVFQELVGDGGRGGVVKRIPRSLLIRVYHVCLVTNLLIVHGNSKDSI